MPGNARKDIVREGEIGVYHCWSRCVQRAFLCGEDPVTGRNFEHRKTWIKSLLEYQASVFAVDVGNYSILSNHQHLIARTRPDIAANWSDEQVAWRWKLAWPQWVDGQWIREPTDQEIEELLACPEHIPQLRANLGNLSWFLARWKEPIAKMANRECGTKGHYYEQRFGSRELVDDGAKLCGFVYVDTNLLKARLATTLEECNFSAIYDRILAWRQQQVQQSLEKFGTNCPEGYDLSYATMDKLLADCFLSPIDDKGPLILLDAAGTYRPPTLDSQPIVIRADSSSSSRESSESETVENAQNDTSPPATDKPSTTDSAATRPMKSQKSAKGKKPTRKIHRRLQSKRRRRASDNPILPIPPAQYRQIVELTAQHLLEPRSQPPPPALDAELQRWGVKPSKWRDAVEHFDKMFHRAVGRTENLTPRIDRAGKKWIQGVRTCRDVFT